MAVYVANAPGEEYDSEHPSGYDSWIDYWNELQYPEGDKVAGKCRNCGKKRKELATKKLEGGHVEYCKVYNDGSWSYIREKGIFITPLCSECNKPDNTEPFLVDESDLIEIPSSHYI